MNILIIFNSFMTEAVSYRNQSIDLFHIETSPLLLYDNSLRHERVNFISGHQNAHLARFLFL